ncbi:MAG: right-handed parallel beta-helix repeat-containing protein [Gammaproteobacteria bacterium]|nr:right-handed parallel beta-helix repeat-containing protein [Gammaproteobacteria bacterium]MBU1483046.1 right-handed parallel beta-helix repeat-containing protein [Gammaproteobacteria bacterium]
MATGSVITISGTTNYDGGPYTVISATSTTFTIAHTYTPETFSSVASWQLAGGMISGCSTTGDTGAITLSTVPSRFIGVAPLSVFFDAAATTATSTTRPFHDLEYRWDFDDPAGSPVSGTTWSTGGRPGVSSRNAAIGPVASHVFESPGIYTVGLTVTDTANTVSNNCALIVVQDPDTVFAGTNTICIAATSLPVAGAGGCPAGATAVQQANFASAINTYAQTGRRVLFKRGDTFTATSAGTIDVMGPGIIGAYGSGVPPIARISASATFPIIQISGPDTPGIGDWRVMDFELDGNSVINDGVSGIATQGGFNQFLALRLNIHNVYRGVAAGLDILNWWNNHSHPGHTIFDEWAVVDSSINGIPGCNASAFRCDWRVYLAGKRNTVQGNYLDNQDTGGSHVLRSEYTNKGVFSNNTLTRTGRSQHAIKLHSTIWQFAGVSDPTGTGVYSEQVIIADNHIIGGLNPWTVSLGPQDEISNEYVRDIVVERNWITSGSGSQLGIETSAAKTTIRNNIFDLTGAAYHTGISISRRGIEPTPSDVHVYNNTFYSNSTGDFEGIRIGTAINTIVRNNLFSAPRASSPEMIVGTGSGLTQSNNLLNNTPSALFVSATPTTPANFGLAPLPSPARDTGFLAVPVLSDFFLSIRPQNSAIDIGAIEGP